MVTGSFQSQSHGTDKREHDWVGVVSCGIGLPLTASLDFYAQGQLNFAAGSETRKASPTCPDFADTSFAVTA